MDVWISNEGEKDLVLEFNSFGIIGNSYSDDIDFCDIELYLNN